MTAQTLAPLIPEWTASARVHAACSTRQGGVSRGPWAGLNLGRSGGDAAEAVSENRHRFAAAVGLPSEPCWLQQVHGRELIRWTQAADSSMPRVDAAYTTEPGVVCAVQAADCMPVLFCDDNGSVVGAAHAGWRGMAAGVLQATAQAMAQAAGIPMDRIQAWLGPAISVAAFEVGAEVRDAFIASDKGAAAAFHETAVSGKFMADLVVLARRALNQVGVSRVSGGHWCTYSDPQRFYSYRRDAVCGRMAAVIWLSP